MAKADNDQVNSVKDHQYLRWDMSTGSANANGFFLGYGFSDKTKKRRLSGRGPRRQMKHNQETWPMTRHAAIQHLRRYANASGDDA